jgi:hypothetical protein
MIEKLKKLSSMSQAEIMHRFREQIRRESDRLRLRAGIGINDDPELDALTERHGASLKTYLLHGPARRFYAATQNREHTVEFITERYPQWLERAIHEADLLCQHRIDLLGYEDVSLGRDIDWHRDPVSGFDWPRHYWSDYDLVIHPPGDAKIIHELNRQQHLPRLAKAFFLTGDERYAFEAIVQIESWIEQNPRGQGINWQSSLEIAIRCISWLWTIFLLLESQCLNEESLRTICRSLFAQLDHVNRYPSVYSSPNTHLIGEAASLFIAGILFAELPRSRRWREFGASVLVDSMERQVHSDGVYAELSSYYHCYAADFYLHALALARSNRISFPESMWSRLASMFDFLMHIIRSDGTIPLLGDDDGGRVLAIASPNYCSYRDGLCSASVLFSRSDFKYQAREFAEESFWLLGDEAWTIFKSLAAHSPVELRRAFESAGYFVQRSGWDPHDTQVVFDCGGLGMGRGGHAHADALSFTVFSGGYEFLIDPGTSVYNGAPDWRRLFRSTSAHNTVVVDGKNQCEPGETFSWRTKAAGRLLRQVELPETDYVDGVVNLGNVLHRRRMVHVRPNYWIVLDELQGRGEHDFDFFYHFAPEAQITVLSDEKRGEINCRARIDDAGLQLCMYASDQVSAEVIQGWASRCYGERLAAPVLKASMRSVAPAAMMSFLVPGNEQLQSRPFKANSNHTIAVAVRDGEYDDIAVMAVEDGDLQLIDCSMRGEFFWLRTENGNLNRLLAVNAYSFSYAGEVIFESKEKIPYVQAYFWENGIVIERGEHEGKVYVRDMRDRQFQRN